MLVATDVAARGIDVTAIETVINYDMPESLDSYTHRVGRTGRALTTGEAVNLASPADLPLVRAIQDQQGEPLEQRVLPGFDYQGFTPELLIVDRTPQRSRQGRGGLGSRRSSSRGGTRRTAGRF